MHDKDKKHKNNRNQCDYSSRIFEINDEDSDDDWIIIKDKNLIPNDTNRSENSRWN